MAYWRKWRNVTLMGAFLHEKSMKTGGKAINYEQPLLTRPLTSTHAHERKIQRRILSHRILVLRGFQWNRSRNEIRRLRVVPISLRDSRASETQARVRITPREKGETRRCERKDKAQALSPRGVSPFSRGVIFTRARVSLALLSLRKNGDYS